MELGNKNRHEPHRATKKSQKVSNLEGQKRAIRGEGDQMARVRRAGMQKEKRELCRVERRSMVHKSKGKGD